MFFDGVSGACGTLLLCCSAGPTGAPGWERPAPFARVWCLFEVFVAIVEDVAVVVCLGPADMTAFRKALNANGMARVSEALAGLDARDAGASVPSDKDMIMADIDASVGIEAFNERVRGTMLVEFKRISMSAGMH